MNKETRTFTSLLTAGNMGNGVGVGVNLDDDDGGVGGVHPRVLIYADCRAPDGALNPPAISGR